MRFIDILQDQSPELLEHYQTIRQRGIDDWVPLLRFEKGSHQGLRHLDGVQRNADMLVPDHIKSEFGAGEAFLLLASVFLHDIGRVCGDEGHIEASGEIIRECWSQLGLPDERIADYCAQVSVCHGLDSCQDALEKLVHDASLEPYGPMRLAFLAAILRVADETNSIWTRGLQQWLYAFARQHPAAQGFKDVRNKIDDVEFCHAGECIILHITGNNILFDQERDTLRDVNTLNRFRKTMDSVIDGWRDFLSEEDIRFHHVLFEFDNKFYEILHPKPAGHITGLAHFFDGPPPSAPGAHAPERQVRPTVGELLDAVASLSWGCLGYTTFPMSALEAKVGQLFTEREEWLLRRMSLSSPHLEITPRGPHSVAIHIEKEHFEDVRRDLGVA